MSVQTIRLNMSTTAQAGAVSRIRLVSQSVTGPVDGTTSAALAAHLADTDDAHDASAVSVADSGGYYTGTNVETVLAELPGKFATAAQGSLADTALQPAAAAATYAPKASPTFTGNVVIPAGNAATEAAQISAYNSSLGQLQIAGVELGDTGWRSCTKTDLGDPANVTTSSTLWRRVGGVVTVRFASFATGASWTDTSGTTNALTIPVGFRPYRGGVLGVARNGTSGATTYIEAEDTASPTTIRAGRANMAANQTLQPTTVTYQCSEAWPASLPGTASSNPPTPA